MMITGAVRRRSWVDRILGDPVPIRLRSELSLAECRQRLADRFDFRLGRWGPKVPVRAWIRMMTHRHIAGRFDGDRVEIMLLGPRQTDFGRMGHTSLPVIRGTLSATTHGTVLAGEIGDTSYTRAFVRLWFGLLLLLFAPVMLLIVVLDASQRSGGVFGLLVVLAMLGFGVVLMRVLRWFRDADGRDLTRMIAAAIDADVELPPDLPSGAEESLDPGGPPR